GDQNGEFVSSITAQDVIATQPAGDDARYLGQALVSDGVAVGVIDLLKIIHIGQNKADIVFLAPGAGDLAFDRAKHRASVVQAGKGIVVSLELRPVAGSNEFIL